MNSVLYCSINLNKTNLILKKSDFASIKGLIDPTILFCRV